MLFTCVGHAYFLGVIVKFAYIWCEDKAGVPLMIKTDLESGSVLL